MKKMWTEEAWEDYLKLQGDKKLLKKINSILRDIERGGLRGNRQARTPSRTTFQATGAAVSMTTTESSTRLTVKLWKSSSAAPITTVSKN